jgi:hypothetical protein
MSDKCIKLLVASSVDYAGLGHSVGRSLRSIGVDCKDVTLSLHTFNYKSQSELVTKATLRTLTELSDHVLIMHSCPTIFDLNNNPSYSVYHTGTRYRESPKYFNELFQGAVRSFTDQSEFMKYGGMKYIVSGVDKNIYKPKEIGRKLIIGHYPSNPEVKGTPEILQMLEPFHKDFDIRIGLKQVSHAEQLARMSECDIYIELFKPELNGREYGCFGVTALEAAMMGKLVITQDLEDRTYRDEYGQHPFVTVKNKYQFQSAIEDAGKYFNQTMSDKIRQDTIDRHSFQATGERLKQLLKL